MEYDIELVLFVLFIMVTNLIYLNLHGAKYNSKFILAQKNEVCSIVSAAIMYIKCLIYVLCKINDLLVSIYLSRLLYAILRSLSNVIRLLKYPSE